MEIDVKIDDELIRKAMNECQEARPEEIADFCYAGMILRELKRIDAEEE